MVLTPEGLGTVTENDVIPHNCIGCHLDSLIVAAPNHIALNNIWAAIARRHEVEHRRVQKQVVNQTRLQALDQVLQPLYLAGQRRELLVDAYPGIAVCCGGIVARC